MSLFSLILSFGFRLCSVGPPWLRPRAELLLTLGASSAFGTSCSCSGLGLCGWPAPGGAPRFDAHVLRPCCSCTSTSCRYLVLGCCRISSAALSLVATHWWCSSPGLPATSDPLQPPFRHLACGAPPRGASSAGACPTVGLSLFRSLACGVAPRGASCAGTCPSVVRFRSS